MPSHCALQETRPVSILFNDELVNMQPICNDAAGGEHAIRVRSTRDAMSSSMTSFGSTRLAVFTTIVLPSSFGLYSILISNDVSWMPFCDEKRPPRPCKRQCCDARDVTRHCFILAWTTEYYGYRTADILRYDLPKPRYPLRRTPDCNPIPTCCRPTTAIQSSRARHSYSDRQPLSIQPEGPLRIARSSEVQLLLIGCSPLTSRR